MRDGEHEMDFDLAALAPQTAEAWVWGTPVLQPHQHDIELVVEGFENNWDTRISSIGIIDGRLHLQSLMELSPLSSIDHMAHAFFYLVGPQGEHVFPYMNPRWPMSNIQFGIDDDGNIFTDISIGEDGELIFHDPVLSGVIMTDYPRPTYSETNFEGDLDRLSEYRIAVRYFTEDIITLNWVVTFDVDIPSEGVELVADGLDIALEGGRAILREVRVTRSHVLIIADYAEDQSNPPAPRVVVHTVDGPRAAEHRGGMNRFDDFNSMPVGFTLILELVDLTEWDLRGVDFLDLDSVISVEVAGHIIDFR